MELADDRKEHIMKRARWSPYMTNEGTILGIFDFVLIF